MGYAKPTTIWVFAFKFFFKNPFCNKLFFKLFLFNFFYFFSFKPILDAYPRGYSFVGIFIKRFSWCGLLWENLLKGIMNCYSPRTNCYSPRTKIPTRDFMKKCYVENLLMNSYVAGNRIKGLKKILQATNKFQPIFWKAMYNILSVAKSIRLMGC